MSDQIKLASRDQVESFIKKNLGEHVGCIYSNHFDLIEKILTFEPNSSKSIQKLFIKYCYYKLRK